MGNTTVPREVEDYKAFLTASYDSLEITTDELRSINMLYSGYFRIADVKKAKKFMNEDDWTKAMMNGRHDNNIQRLDRNICINQIDQIDYDTKASCIIVEGIPGIGKSTFACQLGQHWARNHILNHYYLVVLLRLRDEMVKSAHSVSELFYHPNADIQRKVGEWVSKTDGENMLLILDGYDELPSELQIGDQSIFARLIKGEELRKVTLLVTSRPSASTNLHQLCRGPDVSKHIELCGFSKENIMCYLERSLSFDSELMESFKSYIKQHPHIHSWMYVPFNCALFGELFRDCKGNPPKTLTELYILLTYTLLKRHEQKTQGNTNNSTDIVSTDMMSPKLKCFDGLLPSTISELQSLARLAYQGTINDQLVFYDINDISETLGLLHKVPQLYSMGSPASYNFLHHTLQEFLTAWYVSNQPTSEQRAFVTDSVSKPHMDMILLFMAGLTKFQPSPNDDDQLADVVFPFAETDVRCIENLHRLYEAQNPTLIQRYLGNLELSTFYSNGVLYPHDLYVLGYCIARSFTLWSVKLRFFRFEEEECMRMLFSVEKGNAFHCITSLDLSFNEITIETATQLGLMLTENDTLTHLNLESCKLNEPALVEICKGVQVNKKLQFLDLSDNWITSEIASYLAIALKHNVTLSHLKLDKCHFGGRAICELCTGLKCCSLQTLSLYDNPFDDEGAIALSDALKNHQTLRDVDLHACVRISEFGYQHLMEVVKSNTRINIRSSRPLK